MSDTIGPRTLGQKQGEVFLGRDWGSTPDYSDAVAFEIDQEVRQLIDEAHDVALDILTENRDEARRARGRAAREGDARSRRGRAVLRRRREARCPARPRSGAPDSPCRGRARRSANAARPRPGRSATPVSPPPRLRRLPRPYNPRMSPDRWATFDCYGTLIDWLGGIRDTLADLWPDADAEALAARYHRIEPTVQAGRGIPYRTVMAESLARLADEEGLVIPPGREDALGESMPSWPPFPDVHAFADGAAVARMEARHPVEHRPRLPGRVARRDRGAGRSARGGVRHRLVQAGVRSLGVVLPADPGRPRATRPRGGVALPRRAAVRRARAAVRLDQPAGRGERPAARR